MINYLIFLGTALILFVLFRIVRLVSHRIKGFQKLYPFLVASELTLWIAFIFWLVSFFLVTKSYYNALILVLVVTAVGLLVWFYIKDVIAGFIFRMRHNPTIGQHIESTESSGTIKKVALSQLWIQEESGRIIRIPFARLVNKTISLDTADLKSASETLIHLEHPGDLDISALEKKIKMILLQSPWCVPGKSILVTVLPGPVPAIEVSLHLLDKRYTETAKAKLLTLLNK